MYAKLFASLYQGTLRGRADEILVFTNLLAHCDRFGVVDKHPRAIADECGISVERVEIALLNLEAPDAESRSPELNGCRIARIDEHRHWGWQIVNHAKYRAIRNEDERREQNRLAQDRFRNKRKHNSKRNKPASAGVIRASALSAHAEAEAEAERESDKSLSLAASVPFSDFWSLYPKKVDKKDSARIWGDLDDEDRRSALDNVREHVDRDPRWRDDGGRFIPNPTTYLNQTRWRDGWQAPDEQHGRRKNETEQAWDDFEAEYGNGGSANGRETSLADRKDRPA